MTEEEVRNVLAFAVACIEVCFEGGDLGGAEIQDLAVEHGLLIETTFDPDRDHDPDGCAEAGDPWYVKAAFLKGIKS